MSTTRATNAQATKDVLAYAERHHRLGLVAVHPPLYVTASNSVCDANASFGAVAYFATAQAAEKAVVAARRAAREQGIPA